MITEYDLQEAIAECQGERNPNANTCIKLAAFYTIRNELFGKNEQLTNPTVFPVIGYKGIDNQNGYSFSPAPDEVETTITYHSDTEFGRIIEGRKADDIWPVVDELISEALQTINPRLYSAFIRKIKS